MKGLEESSDIKHEIDDVKYRSLTGALIHLSVHSMPDIAYEVAALCKYIHKPGTAHWEAIKQLLKYLK